MKYFYRYRTYIPNTETGLGDILRDLSVAERSDQTQEERDAMVKTHVERIVADFDRTLPHLRHKLVELYWRTPRGARVYVIKSN